MNLPEKNNDTLYFIYEEDESSGSLYLGSKLIAGSNTIEGAQFLSDLQDVLISANLNENDCLIYDISGQWVNKPIKDILPIFIGTIGEIDGVSGLVPAPTADQTNMFLRSDGTWAEVVTKSIEADNVTLENVDGVLSIVGFKEAPKGAQPIKNEDGSLSWAKPDLTAVEALQEDVKNIEQILNPTDEEGNPIESGLISKVEDLEEIVGKAAEYSEEGTLIAAATGLHAELDQKANAEETQAALDLKANAAEVEEALELKANVSDLNDALNLKANAAEMEAVLKLKANVADVYTKNDTDSAIAAAIANVDHLSREIVDILPDIEDANPNTIYMTPSGLQEDDNKYYEWILINGVFEQVGSWEVDLKAYATKAALQEEVDRAKAAEQVALEAAQAAQSDVDNLKETVAGKADIVYYPVKDEETGETIQIPGEFLTPDDKEKLAALVVDKDGNVGISGSVNANNVDGLGTWLTQNGNTYITGLTEVNISQSLLDKINYITSVDNNNFTVIDGALKLLKVDQSQVDGLNAVITDVNNLNNIINGYTNENNEQVIGLVETVSKLNTKVASLEQDNASFADTYIEKSLFNSTVSDLTTLISNNETNIASLDTRMDEVEKHLVWQRIEN